MPMKRINEEMRGEIKEMTTAGMPVKKIATELELSVPSVYRILAEEGLKPTKAVLKVVDRLSEEDLEHILEQYYDFLPVGEILFQFNLNHNQLYQILQDMGLEPRRKQSQTKEAQGMMIDHALDLYQNDSDMTVDEIVRETGVSQPTIHNEIARRGLEKRRPRRKDGGSASKGSSRGRVGSYRDAVPEHEPAKGQAEPGSEG